MKKTAVITLLLTIIFCLIYRVRDLYTRSRYTKTIDYLLGQINDILAYNLYTSVNSPEEYSLRIINETHQYAKNLLGDKTPSTEPFEIYSIHEQNCYGNYTLGKEVLLAHMSEGFKEIGFIH